MTTPTLPAATTPAPTPTPGAVAVDVPLEVLRDRHDAAPEGVCAVDLEGTCRYANPAAERLLGRREADLIGRDLHDVVHPTRRDGYPCLPAECPVVLAASNGQHEGVLDEDGFWRTDGTFLPVRWAWELVLVADAPVAALVTFTEVTGRADGRLPGALATSTDAFVAIDLDGVLAAWNPAAQQLLGWAPEEMIGRSCLDLLVPDDQKARLAVKLATLGQRDAADFPLSFPTLRVLSRSGERVQLTATVLRICWAGAWRFQVFLRDVDELRRAETSLERSEAMYRLVVGSSRDVISRHAADGTTTFISPAVEELFGWAPGALVGRSLDGLVHPEDLDDVDDGVLGAEGGVGGEWSFRVRHSDGRWVWVESTSTVLRDHRGEVGEVLVCTRDITARLARDAASHQESKLESLGRLSAGLAHEINTPIQYVGDNARFLSDAFADLMGLVARYRDALAAETALPWAERLPAMRAAEEDVEIGYLETEVPSAIAQTLTGIERVATIVRAMKTFSHPGLDEQDLADLNEALTVTATVTGHQVRQVADLELDLGELPPVRCNIAELNQVFLNLIVNAADAVEETGRRGLIRITSAVEGADAVIAVQDTGGGIPEAIRARIFDPFFTTKQVGRGTGQGLPLARAVVQEGHGGRLVLESEIGVGTTLTVRLPIAGAAPAVTPPLGGDPR